MSWLQELNKVLNLKSLWRLLLAAFIECSDLQACLFNFYLCTNTDNIITQKFKPTQNWLYINVYRYSWWLLWLLGGKGCSLYITVKYIYICHGSSIPVQHLGEIRSVQHPANSSCVLYLMNLPSLWIYCTSEGVWQGLAKSENQRRRQVKPIVQKLELPPQTCQDLN